MLTAFRLPFKDCGFLKASTPIQILLSTMRMVGNNSGKNIYICLFQSGGGFSLGSCHFYLEFLITMLDMLKDAGYRAPAIFSLEYTLVPDQAYPAQVSTDL